MKSRLHITIKSEVIITFPDDEKCIIDRQDLELFGRYAWYPAKGHGRTKYLKRNGKEENRTFEFHRFLFPIPEGMEIDHINGNGLDNRRANLQIVTHQQNQAKLPDRDHSSKFRYISWCKTRKEWRAYMNYDGKTKNIGGFNSEIEAAVAANNFILTHGLSKPLNRI